MSLRNSAVLSQQSKQHGAWDHVSGMGTAGGAARHTRHCISPLFSAMASRCPFCFPRERVTDASDLRVFFNEHCVEHRDAEDRKTSYGRYVAPTQSAFDLVDRTARMAYALATNCTGDTSGLYQSIVAKLLGALEDQRHRDLPRLEVAVDEEEDGNLTIHVKRAKK